MLALSEMTIHPQAPLGNNQTTAIKLCNVVEDVVFQALWTLVYPQLAKSYVLQYGLRSMRYNLVSAFMINLIQLFLWSGSARRPLPDAPGTERNIFQQPVPNDSLGISKASPVQHRASLQSTSATMSDLPPDYMQATR